MTDEQDLREMVLSHFKRAGVSPVSVEVRTFPGEVIAIVSVDKEYDDALKLADEIDNKIEHGFVTVRQVPYKKSIQGKKGKVKSVHDKRIPHLIEILTARSRTSENQPSLRYVRDVRARINLAKSPRHNLIFGRRGVGKTALLLEAKRLLEADGIYTLWVNAHSLRRLDGANAFLTVASRLCDMGLGALQTTRAHSGSVTALYKCHSIISDLESSGCNETQISRIIPVLQIALSQFCIETDNAIYLFLDDIHYMKPDQVPVLLDYLHGIAIDNPFWLKVAGIQHQTKWFISNPPTGLQTGHDADLINLDITLEQPGSAKDFLLSILNGYVDECGANPIAGFLSAPAVDRLVLASGGVPRDFLTLTASSLQKGRERPNARTVGVQDVNNAAGEAAATKLRELEDDAASTAGKSKQLTKALECLRKFLLEDHQITYFRIDFKDKEAHDDEYEIVQLLSDLRMLHLINASLSDPHRAGHRAEVYLLDLSQYSGSRLKQRLRVLDFERGHLVLKRTRSKEPKKIGENSRQLMALLRHGPLFPLENFTEIIRAYEDSVEAVV